MKLVKNARPSRERILALAVEECERLNIPGLRPEMIMGQDRRGVVAFVRARVIRRLYATGEYSTTGIGNAFGLHHTSVVHAKNRRNLDGPPTGLTYFLTVGRAEEKRVLTIREEARIIELPYRPKDAPVLHRGPEKPTAPVLASSFIPPIPLARLMAGRA